MYKARDTRLDRLVAIKVSGENFAERFEREAKAVAALNHPNICQLYDVDPNYLVMEYVEGGPVKGPSPEALQHAAQICDALIAAHQKGITHRDLKPGNILLAKSGIKLLDFGLAKFAPPSNPSNEATLTMPLSSKGMILGTLPYMSPEQLEGKEADARSDIFAFGLVLYEIVTGKRAYPLVTREKLESSTLERIVRICLEPDPANRFQSARDLKHTLDWAAEPAPSHPTAPRRSNLLWIIAAVLFLSAAVVGWRLSRQETPDGPLVRFSISRSEGGDFGTPFAVSPDGRLIAFRSRETLWLRALNSMEARPLVTGISATPPVPFWSPDSRWLGFSAQRKLQKIDVTTPAATPLPICETESLRGAAWNSDGTIVFAPGPSGGLFRVPASGGTPTPVTRLDEGRHERSHRSPYFLPGGRRFLYHVGSTDPAVQGIYAGDLQSSEPRGDGKRIVSADANALYVSDGPKSRTGHLLFLRDNNLQAAAFDPDSLTIAREPVVVAANVGRSNASVGLFSASHNGILAFAHAEPARPLQPVWVDRGGRQLSSVEIAQLTNPRDARGESTWGFVSLFSNRSLAWVREDERIWITDLDRRVTSRLTQAGGTVSEAGPVWSPNGDLLAFASQTPPGFPNLFVHNIAGGRTDLVFESSATTWPTDWSSDGKLLIYSVNQGTSFDVRALSLADRKSHPLLVTTAQETHGQLAPAAANPYVMAYDSRDSGPTEVYLQRFAIEGKAVGSGRVQISTKGGSHPRWRSDAKELFYVAPGGRLMAVEIRPGFIAATPRELFQSPHLATQFFISNYRPTLYAVSRDGQRFLVSTFTGESKPEPLTVVVNWQAGLKQ